MTAAIPSGGGGYPRPMSAIDCRQVLWTNVSALMRHHWSVENLNRLAREANIGPATAQRIKQQQTAVGIDVLQRVAACFGIEAWQLLVPGMDPTSPPTLLPMTAAERGLYERLLQAARQFKDQTR